MPPACEYKHLISVAEVVIYSQIDSVRVVAKAGVVSVVVGKARQIRHGVKIEEFYAVRTKSGGRQTVELCCDCCRGEVSQPSEATFVEGIPDESTLRRNQARHLINLPCSNLPGCSGIEDCA